MRLASCLSAAGLLFIAGTAAAQTLRPGLWSMTAQAQDPVQQQRMEEARQRLQSLPPAQRQMVQDMMAKQGVGMGSGFDVSVCLTKDMADYDSIASQQRAGCTTTPGARSGNVRTYVFQCAQPPSSGEVQVTYDSDTAYSSVVTSRSQGRAPTTLRATGRWKSADCGSIAPLRVPK